MAGLFFLAGAQFLGAMQLMLYVGGTVVLLVFGVMLTARGPFVSMQSGGGQWILALLAGGSLLAVLLQTVGQVRPIAATDAGRRGAAAANPTTTQLGAGLVGVRTDKVGQSSRRREDRTRTSATSCRLKSSPSISWSSSWGPPSWRGPSGASAPGNRGWN